MISAFEKKHMSFQLGFSGYLLGNCLMVSFLIARN